MTLRIGRAGEAARASGRAPRQWAVVELSRKADPVRRMECHRTRGNLTGGTPGLAAAETPPDSVPRASAALAAEILNW